MNVLLILDFLSQAPCLAIFQQISIRVSYKFMPLRLVGMARCAQSTQNSKFVISLQYLKKEERIKLIFCAMNITVFYKLILSFLMGVTRHAWSTQNNKYAVSLQYIKKELSYEVDVLHAHKHENLKSWKYYFWWVWPDMPKLSALICNIFVTS